MSANRRMELLNWAANAGAWIVEDEYDAEYRYFGKPVAALQSLDRSGCVIYVGTFTKMLFNALRLGFMVVPERLVDAFETGRSYVDRHPPTLDQAILEEFITEGYFGHHLRRMRQTYWSGCRYLRKLQTNTCTDCWKSPMLQQVCEL
jgi:GntR family transcriptional regulator / MocR family aminotransferase